jgi:hypothetical protein
MSGRTGDPQVVLTGGSIHLQLFESIAAPFRRISQEKYALDTNSFYIKSLELTESDRVTDNRFCERDLTFVFHYETSGELTITSSSGAKKGIVINWTRGTFKKDGLSQFSWEGRLNGILEIKGTAAGNGTVKFDPKGQYKFTLSAGT